MVRGLNAEIDMLLLLLLYTAFVVDISCSWLLICRSCGKVVFVSGYAIAVCVVEILLF